MTLRDNVKVYVPAFFITLALAFALRPVPWPPGLRTGIAFSGFLLTQAILADRITRRRRSLGEWIFTFAIAVVTCIAMWAVDD